MGWVQQISIQFDEFGEKAVAPPGNPRIWDALRASLGDFECFRTQEIVLQSESSKILNKPTAFWSDLLSFQGFSSISVADKLEFPAIQIRRKGENPDTIVTLLKQVLPLVGVSLAGIDLYFLRQVRFTFGTPAEEAKMAELLSRSFQSLISLGLKSGLYDPECEEARFLLAGSVSPWPQSQITKYAHEEIKKQLLDLCQKGEWASIRKKYRLSEYRPRGRYPEKENTINPEQIMRGSEPGKNDLFPVHKSPLHFVVSLPKKPDVYTDLQKIRFRCEALASLYDRSTGLIQFRSSSNSPLLLDVFSPLPINRKTFSSYDLEQGTTLYLLGVWDSRNTLEERRIEAWWNGVHEEAGFSAEFLDGEQDWISYLFNLLTRGNGVCWQISGEVISALHFHNSQRHRFCRVAFVCSKHPPQKLKALAQNFSISFSALAFSKEGKNIEINFGKEGSFDIAKMDIGVSNEERDRLVDVRWDYPELKSPTYGFERVSLHPDEYMQKVSFKSSSEQEWIHQAHLISSGEGFRSTVVRDVACSPFSAFRWSDGAKQWVEAFGSKDGWLEVDPYQAGVAAFDLALRHLLSLGASPIGGVGGLWVSLPDDTHETAETQTMKNKSLAAYLLAIQGVVEAAKSFSFRVETTQLCRVVEPLQFLELVVNLRSMLPKNCPVVVPGFRMTGEVLFVVGPRPAFMDSGSRVLKHVTRVISNHTTKLSLSSQLELYEMLHQLQQQGIVTSIRPIGEGGVAVSMAEMSIWGGIGIQLRPSLNAIELFSAAPGRLIVGVLPQEAKAFEARLKTEMCMPLGTTGGEKVLGMPLSELRLSRVNGAVKI